MIDGQMQEGSGGGERLKERSLRVHKSKRVETWSASHTNKICKKSMMRKKGGVKRRERDGSDVIALDVI